MAVTRTGVRTPLTDSRHRQSLPTASGIHVPHSILRNKAMWTVLQSASIHWPLKVLSNPNYSMTQMTDIATETLLQRVHRIKDLARENKQILTGEPLGKQSHRMNKVIMCCPRNRTSHQEGSTEASSWLLTARYCSCFQRLGMSLEFCPALGAYQCLGSCWDSLC